MQIRFTKTPFFSFLNKILIVISISGIISFGIGFTKYFNHTYYLPLIPNVFDSIFLILSSIYLGINILMLNKKEVKVE
jgi:hypothetical protein